jgi:phosphoribosylamine---glycine ligase
MNILLLGSGGREHAIAWKIFQNQSVHRLFIAPGNAGTLHFGTNLDIELSDFAGIREACVQHDIQMVIVGPEDPTTCSPTPQRVILR